MITIKSFCFNSFEENTYILHDETRECIVIDPGCHLEFEEKELSDYISQHQIKPVRLINTHCHIDHILGNQYVASKYKLKPELHRNELEVLKASVYVSRMYDIAYETSPDPGHFIEENENITFGNSILETLLTPGHSPGSLTFFNRSQGFIISGDVLFESSIGRTDLPGGNFEELIGSIVTKLLPLGDAVVVYPGHGNATTIGREKRFNPFLREHFQN